MLTLQDAKCKIFFILGSHPLHLETIAKAEENFRLYTNLFWKPKLHIKRNATDAFKKRYYHIQAAPDGIFSPLIRKNPTLFQKMINNLVSPGDFYNVSFNLKFIIQPKSTYFYQKHVAVNFYV